MQSPERTTYYERFLRHSRLCTRSVTTQACGQRYNGYSEAFLAPQQNWTRRGKSAHCRCAWVVLACGQRRASVAAYWASWADALSMLNARVPAIAELAIRELESGTPTCACLKEVDAASRLLDQEGFVKRPLWESRKNGERPRAHEKAERGEWNHRWQYFASSSREHHFRKSALLLNSRREASQWLIFVLTTWSTRGRAR